MKRDPRDPMRALTMMPGTPTARTDARGKKTAGTRLRKLVCSEDCGYPPLRVSRAAIDRGLPTCPCGAIFWPFDLDDVARAHEAGHLSDAQYAGHPLVAEYNAQVRSVQHGQAAPGRAASLRGTDHFKTPEAAAAWRVAEMVREENQRAKLAAARALQPEPEPIPF